MSAPTDTATKPTSSAPESPTTARPLEMDDDEIQESGVLDEGARPGEPSTLGSDAAPPPKPPRPVTEQQKNELILKEAFPDVELGVIKAVLSASGGRVEPAFNALLSMTDPDAAQREHPPPQPPRPAADARGVGVSQVEADEQYARRLAQQYENAGAAYEQRTSNQTRGGEGGYWYDQQSEPRGRGHNRALSDDEDFDREHSFIDDDLPAIRDNLRKGFVETQAKVNTWFTNLKKKIDEQFDGDDDDEGGAQRPARGRPSRFGAGAGGRQGQRSDYDRYDADPQVLSDDFAGMKFHSDGTPVAGQFQQANTAGGNTNLFRPPQPVSPKPSASPGGGRRVAFKDGVENIDPYKASPSAAAGSSAGAEPAESGGAAKQNKWQPLSTADSAPTAEHDPFSLGDSDDDNIGAIKLEDKERMQKAAAEAMADNLVGPKDAAKDSEATASAEAKK